MKKIIALFVAVFLAVTLTACESSSGTSDSRKTGQKQTEQAFKQQSDAVPYPVSELRDSQERRNLKERLLRQNKANHIGYVYILSFGKFIGYYTIKGKISSTQSQMTPSDSVSKFHCPGSCSDTGMVTEAPGDDGSYGPNEDGVFFFTTSGAMVQTDSDYIYSDQPIGVGGIPELNK